MKTETDLDSCLVSRMSEYAFAAELDPGHVTSIYNDLSNFKNDKKLTSLILDLVASPQFVRRDK